MFKGKKLRAVGFTLLFWIFLTLIISNVIITVLVPVANEHFRRGMSGTAHQWYDESRYVAAWDRPLMAWEVSAIIEGAKSEQFGGNDKFYHLLHHGNEARVRSGLFEAAVSGDNLKSLVAEFALFKLKDNSEERLDRVLEYAVTGGLSSDKMHFLGDSGWIDLEPGPLRDEICTAVKVQWRALDLIPAFLDPIEDTEYLTQIADSITNDRDFSPYLIWVVAPFRDEQSASEIIGRFEDRFEKSEIPPWRIGYPGEEQEFHEWIESSSAARMYDEASYDGKARINLRLIYTSYGLIAVWLIFTALYAGDRIKTRLSAP